MACRQRCDHLAFTRFKRLSLEIPPESVSLVPDDSMVAIPSSDWEDIAAVNRFPTPGQGGFFRLRGKKQFR
jgi:hypothetical protein